MSIDRPLSVASRVRRPATRDVGVPERLVEHLERHRLARPTIPTTWTVVPALPTTASGKIQKHLLPPP